MSFVAEISTRLDASAKAIGALVADAGPELATFRPSPSKWSILEILGHLRDEERRDFRVRVDYTLHRPGEHWPPIDPERWVKDGRFNERTVESLLAEFMEERHRSIAWLATLHDADWSTAYRHETLGDFTAASMLCAWAAHDLLHLRQIEGVMYVYLAHLAPPDRLDYAGAW
jgi:hypothetical protein